LSFLQKQESKSANHKNHGFRIPSSPKLWRTGKCGMTANQMKLDIKATNLEITDAISSYVEEKLGDLEKYIPNIKLPLEGKVELARTTLHHKTGDIFRAEMGDIYAAIDAVKDQIREEIKAYKERFITRDRKSGRLAKFINNYSPLSWLRGKFTKEEGE
jgi:putative sigma-54 modulation protein